MKLKNAIIAELEKQNFKIVSFEITNEIVERYSEVYILSAISLKCTKDENIYEFEYTTDDKSAEEKYRCIFDIIKTQENIVLKEYQDKTETQIEKSNDEATIKIAKIKKFDNFTFKITASKDILDLKKFITNKEFIQYWAGPSFIFENDDSYSFENIQIRILKAEDKRIVMKYKWKEWENFCDFIVELVKYGNDTIIKFRIENSPLGLNDNIKHHIKDRIFGSMSMVFGFRIFE